MRIKLKDRQLPDYFRGEEIMNMVTHIVGGGLGLIAMVLCVVQAALHRNAYGVVGSVIDGFSLIALYTVSSVYHGLKPGMGKKVMQVLDHCTIYLLIAGSYTPIALSALREVSPALGWGIFGVEWGLLALAVTLTAIDLRQYREFSMICYIGMGWAIIPFWKTTMEALGAVGFGLLLAGGILYTIGAILYGIGSKRHWIHSVFHIFVVLGSICHFFAIFLYAI